MLDDRSWIGDDKKRNGEMLVIDEVKIIGKGVRREVESKRRNEDKVWKIKIKDGNGVEKWGNG